MSLSESGVPDEKKAIDNPEAEDPSEGKTWRVLNGVIEGGILGLIVFSPLPRASVQAWSILSIQLTVLLLIIACILMPGKDQMNGRLKEALKWPRVLAFGFFAWIVFQILPLPSFLVKIISPHTFSLHSQYNSSSTGGHFMGLSLVPSETLRAGSELLTYFLLGFLILRTLTSIKQIRRLIGVIIAMGFIEALYGMFELYNKNPRILFYWKDSSLDSVTGTFVNRNHFSGYLEMIVPLAMGLIIARLDLFSLSGLKWRQKLLAIMEKGLLVNLLLAIITIIMCIAIVFSHSRSGIATLILTFIFFFGFAAFFKETSREQKKLMRNFIKVMFLTIALLSVTIGISSTVQRFSLDKILHEGRSIIWTQTLQWIGRFPIFGTGLGTFASLNPGSEEGGTLIGFYHAHNDYLEYLMEVGAIGLILLLAVIFFMLGRSLAAWQTRRDSEIKGLALGGIMSCLSILFHSATDFNMHIPANTLLFSVVLSLTMVVVFQKKNRENCS
jgi:O-antigen ligase